MKLKPNDNIGVSAPADYIKKNAFYKTKKYVLKKYKLNLVPSKNLFSKYGCFSGTDNERLSDINSFIKDSSVKSIFFAKGGWGSGALLPYIDYKNIKKYPKLLMGYSDTTSILLAVHSLTNTPVFYGPMVTSDFCSGLHPLTEKCFKTMIMDSRLKSLALTESETSKIKVIKSASKKISGTVIAGCLSVFVTLLGTKYLKIPNNAILFLEDTGEELYKIDRMLTHIRNSGILKKCRAVILDIKDYKPKMKNIDTVPFDKRLLDLFAGTRTAVIRWDCFGHRKKKVILPIGNKLTIDLKEKQFKFNIKY